MTIQNVVVAGGGVLGSQIALMCAYAGHHTTILIKDDDVQEQTEAKLERYSAMMIEDLEQCKQLIKDPLGESKYPKGLISDWKNISPEQLDEMEARVKENTGNIRIERDITSVFQNADLVIEAVTEDPQIKTAFYESVRDYLPEKTLMVTNSSTLLPSRFAEHTGRPERYCALHFANTIWRCNTAEIMGHAGTDPESFQSIVTFAKGINMITLPLHKEQPGYILNSMLVPWLAAGEALWVNGVADPETIDLTWKAGLGCPFGPFEHIDVIGLETVYNINLMKPDVAVEGSTINRLGKMLKEKIDQGETGVNAGVGFYDYRENS